MRKKGIKYSPEIRVEDRTNGSTSKDVTPKDISDNELMAGLFGGLAGITLATMNQLHYNANHIPTTIAELRRDQSIQFSGLIPGAILGVLALYAGSSIKQAATNYISKNKNVFWAPNQDSSPVSDSNEQQLRPS